MTPEYRDDLAWFHDHVTIQERVRPATAREQASYLRRFGKDLEMVCVTRSDWHQSDWMGETFPVFWNSPA